MADELDKKLKQIADMFGVSDTSGLKNIVESIVPPGQSSENENSPSSLSSSNEEKAEYTPPPPSHRDSSFDPGLMSKANEMIGMFNNVKDSRITLLNSIQPFLGSQRQQRLGGAIQLLKVINIIGTIAPTFNRDTKG
ncbi:MAG: hypothetical protein ACOYIG_06170 [Acetivibrionales bacterium]|jgi:hypothetical protein|nr:hypothetical protein [Clostridiaceae bacterium]